MNDDMTTRPVTAGTRTPVGVRAAAHAVLVVGIGADVAGVALNPPTTFTALVPYGLAAIILPVVTLIVGWLLAVRRPRLVLGWLLGAIGLLLSTETAIGALGVRLVPGSPSVAQWLLWYGGADQWAWIPPVGLLFTQIPLRFPNGSLPSPRWRWFSILTMGALALTCAVVATLDQRLTPTTVPNPTYIRWGDAAVAVVAVPAALTAVAFAGSVASLVVRYRRSASATRAQLRWIFWAAAVVAGLLVLSWFGDPSTPGIAGVVNTVISTAAALSYPLVPISILVAVLRHGLYSIDRIISRTASYAIITASTVAVYTAVVLLVSLVLPGLASVGVALATLAAAAVFFPLLRAVRRVVDRRFDRAQYDAEKVVVAFGEHIRSGADPHTAAADLVAAVERTLQPITVGVWVKRDG